MFSSIQYSATLTKAWNMQRTLFYLNVDTNMPSLSNGACQNKFAGPDHCQMHGHLYWGSIQAT